MQISIEKFILKGEIGKLHINCCESDVDSFELIGSCKVEAPSKNEIAYSYLDLNFVRNIPYDIVTDISINLNSKESIFNDLKLVKSLEQLKLFLLKNELQYEQGNKCISTSSGLTICYDKEKPTFLHWSSCGK